MAPPRRRPRPSALGGARAEGGPRPSACRPSVKGPRPSGALGLRSAASRPRLRPLGFLALGPAAPASALGPRLRPLRPRPPTPGPPGPRRPGPTTPGHPGCPLAPPGASRPGPGPQGYWHSGLFTHALRRIYAIITQILYAVITQILRRYYAKKITQHTQFLRKRYAIFLRNDYANITQTLRISYAKFLRRIRIIYANMFTQALRNFPVFTQLF